MNAKELLKQLKANGIKPSELLEALSELICTECARKHCICRVGW